MTDLDRARADAIAHHAVGVNGARLVEYRCRHRKRCLLLRVWQTPSGPEFVAHCRHTDGFYLLVNSADRIEFSSRPPAEVGVPHIWAGRIEDHKPSQWVPLSCNHYRGSVPISDVMQHVANGTPGDPIVVLRPDDTPA